MSGGVLEGVSSPTSCVSILIISGGTKGIEAWEKILHVKIFPPIFAHSIPHETALGLIRSRYKGLTFTRDFFPTIVSLMRLVLHCP